MTFFNRLNRSNTTKQRFLYFFLLNSVSNEVLCKDENPDTTQLDQIKAKEKTAKFHDNLMQNYKDVLNDEHQKKLLDLYQVNYEQEILNRDIKIAIKSILDKQDSIWHKILVDMVLKTVIVTVVQKGVDFAGLTIGTSLEGKNMVMNVTRDTNRTLNRLFSEQNPQKLLNNGMKKLILTESTSQIFYSLITEINSIFKTKKHFISLQPLIIFAGVGGTGKTSLAFLLQQYTMKRFGKKPSLLKRIMSKTPATVRSAFNIYEDDRVMNLTISGSYFFNQSDFDKSASLLDNMLQVVTDYISNNPNRIVVIVIEEGEVICNIPQFVTVLKSVTAIWERLHQTKRKNGTRANGVVLLIITTNHGSDVNNYLSRRALYVQFVPPSEVDKLYIFTKYLESGLGAKYYTATIKDNVTEIVRLCERFSPSDIENMISLLSFNKNLLHSMITLTDILGVIEGTLVKMQAVVYKDSSDGETKRREVVNIKKMVSEAAKAQRSFIDHLTDTSPLDTNQDLMEQV